MATNGERNVGLKLAAAGVAMMGVSLVFGLTTDTGAIDWIGVIMATAGLIVVLAGMFRAYWRGAHHPG